MTESHPSPRRSRLRALALGLGAGLAIALLAATAGDLADRITGAGEPALRARVRRVVTASQPYLDAVDLARTSTLVRDALGGVSTVELDTCSVEDGAEVTRLRFALRLKGTTASGRLDVVATYERAWVERRVFTRDGAPPVDLTVTLPSR